MTDAQTALDQLQHLCRSIKDFHQHTLTSTLYRAPVIDWHHPDDYSQKAIAGLRKFLSTAEAERDHVAGVVNSAITPREVASNAPHLVAVWEEFIRASWPLTAIAQTLDYGTKVPVKVDIIARGGEEWIKVNTIKESRLLSEFREQDSYVNSDYDSDTSSPGAGPSTPCIHTLSNSLIKQGETLLRAAERYPRLPGRRCPVIRMVLNRLIRPQEGFQDSRIEQTITHLQNSGIIVQLGPTPGPPRPAPQARPLRPTKKIVLDLSVLVALCCDSTHHPLPTIESEFESRFRPLHLSTTNKPELGPHSNTSKDLRDQLQWEAQHPLIQELQDQLQDIVPEGEELEFWITEEVRGRLPGLVDVIGGPEERRRGRALLREKGEEEGGFWKGSRWEGKEGVLRDLRVRVLSEADGPVLAQERSKGELQAVPPLTHIESATDIAGVASGLSTLDVDKDNPKSTERSNCDIAFVDSHPILDSRYRPSTFQINLASTCKSLLYTLESATALPSTPPLNPTDPHPSTRNASRDKSTPAEAAQALLLSQPISTLNKKTPKQPRHSRHPDRTQAIFPTNRYPSAHTLRTLIAGAERGWTVLTNNRGAIGKVSREMGLGEGLPAEKAEPGDMDLGLGLEQDRAALWVVNPSSLSEWRRLEVEKENERIKALIKDMQIS